ncbi:MAG: GrpB family protein [Candidatus Limnocylindrales bacterium]
MNLHVFPPDCREVERFRFRDWLRTHDEDRALYERTKRDLAARPRAYVQHYADAKSAVVEEILARATADPPSAAAPPDLADRAAHA